MDSDKTLAQLRQILLIIAAGVFVMTVAELTFLEHWNFTIQFLPFTLCALGLVTSALAYFRPNHNTILLTQWSMIVIAVCSLIGFYEHMAGNLTFWQEVQPNATAWELVVATFKGGVPILAPGILTLGGAIGWTATFKHPALTTK
ncbi:MAG: hypothetical protein IPP66_19215 [Anaerolineales bacterium]|nr:hypothetical protein [Anaerolineales bacterium]